MGLFEKEKPNREVYKTAYWRAIDPLDRAHILLVAEGVKPMAYTDFTDIKSVKDYLSKELKIWITEARGRRKWFPTETGLHLPHKVYTICGSEKTFKFIQELWGSPNQSHYWDYEGKLLGYPKCCREEYVAATYRDKFNAWIIKLFGRRPYTFMIQSVRRILERKKIPEEFLYLMPSQTPCSVGCRRSIKLLNRWKRILYKYDPKAAEAIKEFNEGSNSARFQAIVDKLKKKKVSSDMFRKGYIFSS
jgi:hypothetical protein